jgi:hypothetical protein
VPEDLFRPQLGEPHHSAYVVDDIETTVRRLVDQLGAGPFFLIENVPLEDVLSRGEPAEFVHNSAFGYCGDGAIELIETVSLAPERVENGFSAPRARIQHVAYVVPSTEVVDDRLLTAPARLEKAREVRRPRPRPGDRQRDLAHPRLPQPRAVPLRCVRRSGLRSPRCAPVSRATSASIRSRTTNATASRNRSPCSPPIALATTSAAVII